MKHMRINNVPEQFRNLLIETGMSGDAEAMAVVAMTSQQADDILSGMDDKIAEINANPGLNNIGKRDLIAVAQAEARGQVAAIDTGAVLEVQEKAISGQLINATCVARGVTIHGEPLKPVSDMTALRIAIEGQESRLHIQRREEQARAAFADLLAQAAKEGTPVPDHERVFRSPIAKEYWETMANFTEKDRQFVNMLERAPRGVKVFGDDTANTLALGQQLLEKRVAPELYAKRASISITGQGIDLVMNAVHEVIENPKHNRPIKAPRQLQPDTFDIIPPSAAPDARR